MKDDFRKVKTPGALLRNIEDAKARIGARFTQNRLLPPDELEATVKEGRLSFCETEGGVLVLHELPSHYRLHAFVDPEKPISVAPRDKFVLARIAQNVRRPFRLLEKLAENLCEAGFEQQVIGVRMSQTRSEQSTSPASVQKVRVAVPPPEAASEIGRLFSVEGLNPFERLEVEEIEELIKAGQIVAAFNEDGRLAGALQWEFGKAAVTLRRLAVDPSFQNDGLGAALVAAFFSEADSRGSFRHVLWVDSKNERAIRFYQRYGYVLDGAQTLDYVLPAG